MKRVGDMSPMFYSAFIYAVFALYLPIIFELVFHSFVGFRIVSGSVDALESVTHWTVLIWPTTVAALIPAFFLVRRYSEIELLARVLVVSILSEILVSSIVLWVSIHPPVGHYPILSTLYFLNVENLAMMVPHVSYAAVFRVGILPVIVLGMVWVKSLAHTHRLFARNFIGSSK